MESVVAKAIVIVRGKLSNTPISNRPMTDPAITTKLYTGRIIGKDKNGNSTEVLYSADTIKALNPEQAARKLLINAVKAGRVDDSTLFSATIDLVG